MTASHAAHPGLEHSLIRRANLSQPHARTAIDATTNLSGRAMPPSTVRPVCHLAAEPSPTDDPSPLAEADSEDKYDSPVDEFEAFAAASSTRLLRLEVNVVLGNDGGWRRPLLGGTTSARLTLTVHQVEQRAHRAQAIREAGR